MGVGVEDCLAAEDDGLLESDGRVFAAFLAARFSCFATRCASSASSGTRRRNEMLYPRNGFCSFRGIEVKLIGSIEGLDCDVRLLNPVGRGVESLVGVDGSCRNDVENGSRSLSRSLSWCVGPLSMKYLR